MSELGETPGGKTIRLGLEAKIKDFHQAGDSHMANYHLERWPHGHLRALGGTALQPTEEIPVITAEMLEEPEDD